MKDIKIANNIKNVELLKVELLKSVSALFENINSDADNENNISLTNDTADIINLTFVLARRLGLDYDSVLDCMKKKLETGIRNQHTIEKSYHDMSELLERL